MLRQLVPHAPQWLGSLLRSTHAPPQSVRPAEQLVAHAPVEQTEPPEHAAPHAPQFAGSFARATQAPPHRVVAGTAQGVASLPGSAASPASAGDVASGPASRPLYRSMLPAPPHAFSVSRTRSEGVDELRNDGRHILRAVPRRVERQAQGGSMSGPQTSSRSDAGSSPRTRSHRCSCDSQKSGEALPARSARRAWSRARTRSRAVGGSPPGRNLRASSAHQIWFDRRLPFPRRRGDGRPRGLRRMHGRTARHGERLPDDDGGHAAADLPSELRKRGLPPRERWYGRRQPRSRLRQFGLSPRGPGLQRQRQSSVASTSLRCTFRSAR